VLAGGYGQKFASGGWTQITGSAAKPSGKSRVLVAPAGSRRQRRAKSRVEWSPSDKSAARNAARLKAGAR
jgi:hypothetical protein